LELSFCAHHVLQSRWRRLRQEGGLGRNRGFRLCSMYVVIPGCSCQATPAHSIYWSPQQYFNKPQWTELLPPPLSAPHQKPYTLLLSMDDLLVTSTWDVGRTCAKLGASLIISHPQRQQGWRTAKRPGVDYFIAYLSQFYEIVIFTTQHHYVCILR